MGYYTKNSDKKSGDGLSITEWNDLSSAVAGNSGLTLALNSADNVGIGTDRPAAKLAINGGLHVGGDSDPGHSNLAVDGKVGIGTDNPKQTLTVEGNWRSGKSERSGLSHGGNLAIVSDAPQIDFIDTDDNDWAIHVNDNKMYFVREPWSYDDLVLDGAGSVGIGTRNPSAKLEVSGDVKANRFIGDGSQLTNLTVGVTGLNLATTNDSKVGIGTTEATHKLHVKTHDAVGLFESTSTQAYLRLSTSEGFDKRVEFTNRPGGRASIWVSKARDALNILANGNVGIGTINPSAPLSIAAEEGKERVPDSAMHITNDCILFGGKNNGKQTDSAQISAGKHSPNSLNIVGMSSNTSANNRKIDAYAEGGLNIIGKSNVFTITMDSENLYFKIRNSGHGGSKSRQIRWDGDSNWDSASDRKLKTDIANEENILNRLMQLEVKTFRWKGGSKKKEKLIGFVAQDVKPLFPSLVGEMKDPETSESTLTLKYANFGVLAIGAIKELKLEYDTQVAALKQEIADLKGKLDA